MWFYPARRYGGAGACLRAYAGSMGESLATEASIACECHALKDAGMERVVAEADATNVGSLRVIEKLGMRLVGNINAGAPRESYYAVYLAEFRADMGRSKRWSNRAYVSSHVPLDSDGSVVGPFGKVDAEISEEEGYEAARLTALAILASLRRELGDLDRVSASLRVFGKV